jgi:hypothetical protein
MSDDPFDLDSLDVEGENDAPFTFTYKGEKYTMPVAAAMPWQDQLALENATQLESLRLILGDEQFRRFEKAPMSSARLAALLGRWMSHQGLKPGE